MGPDEARRLLGVHRQSTPEEVRSAYRRQMRAHHPDVAGAASTRRAARLVAAYQVLTRPPGSPPPGPAPTPSGARPPAGPPPAEPPRAGDDTIPLAAPTLTVFDQLCQAADVIGDVSYVDASTALLETIVSWDGWPPCSLLITLLQRGDDTLAQCTLESLTGRPGPPIEHVVRELHRVLAALSE